MTIVPAALAGVALIILFLRVADPDRPRADRRALGAGAPARADGAAHRERAGDGRGRHARGADRCCAIRAAACSPCVGAIGFWAANIAVLWACFHAFGEDVPKAVLVQGFFVGMTANLLPFFPGGVGSVDAGMIAAFLAFGEPSSTVFVSVLAYRVIAFWLPIPPGHPGLPPAAADGGPVARGGRAAAAAGRAARSPSRDAAGRCGG